MKIKTSYDCTFERKDFVNLAHGHNLSATLSDGSVAFTFKMDDEVRQALQEKGGDFTRQVNGVVVANGTRQLTNGTRPKKGYLKKGVCPYCKPPRPPLLLEPHIRAYHHGKPKNPTGTFRCPKCIERYDSEKSLGSHLAGPLHGGKRRGVKKLPVQS